MILPTEKLKRFMKMYPNKKILADKWDTDEATISRILSGERDIPKSLIETIHLETGWGMDELFEVKE